MRDLLGKAADFPLLAAGALVAGPVAWLSYLNRHQQVDDALIYHRYFRNFLRGQGLTYNPGEAFNALTSPLYSYLAIAASALSGDVQTGTIVLSGACLTLALAVFAAVFARSASLPAALYGALLMAGSRFFYFTYGLETPLFVLLIGLCLLLFERRDDFWLGIACALLLLTRGEGLFLILSLALVHRVQGRPWPAIRCYAAPALLLLSHALFNILYYGSLLPHTAAAKIHHGASGLWSGLWLTHFRLHYYVFFGHDTGLIAGFAALVACGAWSLRRTALSAAVLPFLALYAGFYLILKIPHYHWYYGPFYAFGCFYAGAGGSWLIARARGLPGPTQRAVSVVGVALLLAFVLGRSLAITPSEISRTGPIPEYRAAGVWLRDHTPASTRVAAVEIGALGWYSERPIVDIVGLVSPENARLLGERRFGAWLDLYEPDYIVVHRPPWPYERGVGKAMARGDYALEERWTHPRLMLLRRRGS